jgi:hypothetical protein
VGRSVWGRCQPGCRRVACDSSSEGRRGRALAMICPRERGGAGLAPAAGLIRSLSAFVGVTHHSPAVSLRTQTGTTGAYERSRRIRRDACRRAGLRGRGRHPSGRARAGGCRRACRCGGRQAGSLTGEPRRRRAESRPRKRRASAARCGGSRPFLSTSWRKAPPWP